jgi:hypothetical protein
MLMAILIAGRRFATPVDVLICGVHGIDDIASIAHT